MNRSTWMAAVCLTAWTTAAWGADLTKIDRSIAKEPVYQTKPKYCLLVFGPEAKFRAWLVQDGNTLYVDRNGNGDLTEEGKRVKLAQESPNEGDMQLFQAGDLHDGKLTHTGLSVTRYRTKP